MAEMLGLPRKARPERKKTFKKVTDFRVKNPGLSAEDARVLVPLVDMHQRMMHTRIMNTVRKGRFSAYPRRAQNAISNALNTADDARSSQYHTLLEELRNKTFKSTQAGQIIGQLPGADDALFHRLSGAVNRHDLYDAKDILNTRYEGFHKQFEDVLGKNKHVSRLKQRSAAINRLDFTPLPKPKRKRARVTLSQAPSAVKPSPTPTSPVKKVSRHSGRFGKYGKIAAAGLSAAGLAGSGYTAIRRYREKKRPVKAGCCEWSDYARWESQSSEPSDPQIGE